MTLEQAIAKARELGFKWVAVDEDGLIMAYLDQPEKGIESFVSKDVLGAIKSRLIGVIAEPINWQESLTEIK